MPNLFLSAIEHGEYNLVKAFIVAGVNLNKLYTSADGYPEPRTALHVAVMSQDFAMIQLLLDKGANPYQEEGRNDLLYKTIAYLEPSEISVMLIHCVLTQGADYNYIPPGEKDDALSLFFLRYSEKFLGSFFFAAILKGDAINSEKIINALKEWSRRNSLLLGDPFDPLILTDFLQNKMIDINACNKALKIIEMLTPKYLSQQEFEKMQSILAVHMLKLKNQHIENPDESKPNLETLHELQKQNEALTQRVLTLEQELATIKETIGLQRETANLERKSWSPRFN